MDAASDRVVESCPVDLTVSVGLAAADLCDSMFDYLSGQPLLPRWRLVVVGAEGDLAADVAVVPGTELPRLHHDHNRRGGFVLLLDEPAEVRSWTGVGSLVLVGDPRSHVARAVEETAQGRVWISDGLVPFLAAAISGRREPADPVPVPRQLLTPTEDKTLKLLLEGMSNTDIAAARGVSLSTVKSCVRTVLGKYGCDSRQQLIALFVSRDHDTTDMSTFMNSIPRDGARA